MSEVLTRTLTLACPVEHAFETFTRKIDLWWPRGHRRSPEAALRLDPVAGGRLVERAPDGSEWAMGRVTDIDPPSRLNLDWFPGSPAAPTAVEVQFAESGGGTIVTITHRPLSPEAEAIWPQRVAIFTKGWDTVLPALRSFIEAEEA